MVTNYGDIFLIINSVFSPFLNEKKIFDYGKYQKFFIDFDEKKLLTFYSTTNKAVISLVTSLKNLPKEGKFLIGYALDLIALLCSDLNIKARVYALDNTRAHVDVHKFDTRVVVGDMIHIMDQFKKEENEVVIIPADYSLTYNVSDYIILIFNKKVRFFDLPHFYETKSISPNTVMDDKMIRRIEKQKQRTSELIKNYDNKRDTLQVFTLNESYFNKRSNEIIEKINQGKGEIIVDEIFTLIITDQKKISNTKDFFYNNMFEEFSCVAILPLVFRGISLNIIQLLLEKNIYIQIKTERKKLTEKLKQIKCITKIDNHPNPFQTYVYINDVGKISLANVIHYKFDFKTLAHVFDNYNIYTQECHGIYGTDEIINHKMPVRDLLELEQAYSLIYSSSFPEICEFATASWNLTESFLKAIKKVGGKKLSAKQRVCIFMLGKNQRLLRTAFILIIHGYYPEAEILIRSMFEAKLLVSYILEDKTDKRAEKWLNFEKPSERWPIFELNKKFSVELKNWYSLLSTYPHNHPVSLAKFVNFDKENTSFSIESGPVGNREHLDDGGFFLGYAGMENASICELSANLFDLNDGYGESYKKLTETSYYKTKLAASLEMMRKNPEIVEDIEKMIGNN